MRRRSSPFTALRPLPIALALITLTGLAVGQVPERVHHGDVLDVDFVGNFDFDWRGGLNLSGDLDGLAESEEPIHGLCRTEAEIAAEIEKAYSKILKEPKVNVRIVDRTGRAPAVLYGAVKTPARFRIMREIHLRELLVRAGGLTDNASGEISILRSSDGCDAPETAKTVKVTINDLLSGSADANLAIASGDIVTVERAAAVYVIGAVNNPRPVYTRSEMTVSRAIASAGGLAKQADGKRVAILRRENGETKSIDVDLTAIKTDPSKDAVLQPFDILDVASRGGGKRKLPSDRELSRPQAGANELPLRIVD